MTEMYAPYSRYYALQRSECSSFDAFADSLRQTAGWNSDWFKTAQRFFLYGAAKEFEADFGIVDRVLDYMIAMEAALVTRIQSHAMRLSARNHLVGTIVELALGDLMAHVVVKVGENIVESVITRRSAEEMSLKVGDTVAAVIKSTEVMLQKA
jgi:molybdopterin-binding protein